MDKKFIISALYSYILIITIILIYRLLFLSDALPVVGNWGGTNEYQHEVIFQNGHFTTIDDPAYNILYAYMELVIIQSSNLLDRMSISSYLNPLGVFLIMLSIILIMRKMFKNNETSNLSYLYIIIIIIFSIFYNYGWFFVSYEPVSGFEFIRLYPILILFYIIVYKNIKNYRNYVIITILLSLIYLGYHTYAVYTYFILTGICLSLFIINKYINYIHILIINTIVYFIFAVYIYGNLLFPLFAFRDYFYAKSNFYQIINLPIVGSFANISFNRVLSIISNIIYLFILIFMFSFIINKYLRRSKLENLEFFILYFYIFSAIPGFLFITVSPLYLFGRIIQPFELAFPFIFVYFFKSFIFKKNYRNLKRHIVVSLLIFNIFLSLFLSITYTYYPSITYQEYSALKYTYSHLQNNYKIFSDFNLGTIIYYFYFSPSNACWPFQNNNDQSSEFIYGLYNGNITLKFISNICNTDNWLFIYDIKYQTAPFFSTPIQALQPLPNDTLEKLNNLNLPIIFNNGMIILFLHNH